jgi:hypothetical protein
MAESRRKYAPEAKEHADFVKRAGPEFLGRFPEIKSLELLERGTEGAAAAVHARTHSHTQSVTIRGRANSAHRPQ